MTIQNSNIIDEIIGYPPSNCLSITNEMIRKSMPVVEFTPSIPSLQGGQDIYSLNPAWESKYLPLLKEHGFNVKDGQKKIKAAFIADSFPTDTFTNEYGENFLQKFTDVASEGLASLAQITGSQSLSDTYKALTSNLEGANNPIAQTAGEAMRNIASTISNATSNLQGPIGNALRSGVSIIDVLGAGGRLDFPMVWKSSSFQPSYTLTVRLYNPYPQDPEYTKKYIVGPLTALLLLGLPQKAKSDKVSAFTWPFFHDIKCEGLFHLNPGYISNITVIKGGDQQQISFQQRMGIVDIRIDMGSVYSSILADGKDSGDRPTLKKYIKTLTEGKKVTTREDDNYIIELEDKYIKLLSSPEYIDDISDTNIPEIPQNNTQKYLNSVSATNNISSQATKISKTNSLSIKNTEITQGKKKITKEVTKKISSKAVDSDNVNTRISSEAQSRFSQLQNAGIVSIG